MDEDAVADEPAPAHDGGEAEDLLGDDAAVAEDAGAVGAHPAGQPVHLVVVVHHDYAVGPIIKDVCSTVEGGVGPKAHTALKFSKEGCEDL